MSSYLLSKSTYIRGLQCLKSLYLNKNRPYLRDKISEEQLAKFERGHAIGKLAQQLFPGGTEVFRPGLPAASRTADLISEGCPVIYEACFIHDEVIIAIDILVKNGEAWNAYEVKSSGALSETYYNDARLQEYVIKGSGLPLNEFFLVHRNLELEVDQADDIRELFIFTLLPANSEEENALIAQRIAEMKQALSLRNSPDIKTGPHCMKPYPCDFRGICWKNLSDAERNSLLEI